jgi:hypothetical protein
VTAVGVLAIAGGVGLFLFLTHGQNPKTEPAAEARGLACPYLHEATIAYERRNGEAYKQAINQAMQVAEATLQNSGQVFGEPERTALALGLGTQERIPELLAQAETVCSRLGQWNKATN